MANNPTETAIDKTIQQHIGSLNKPGVLTVRPGYEIANEQLTGKPAVVATVHTKKPAHEIPQNELLPDKIGGQPVDVREASAQQRLRAHDPVSAAVAQTYSRPEDAEPDWPLEREMPGGQLLTSPASETQKAMTKNLPARPASSRALSAHAKKPQIDYVPATGHPLTPVHLKTTITALVSPDAGLVTLEDFLKATKNSLVIGMYDFTSATLLKDFEVDLGTPRTLQMVLDNPALNPTANQSDWQTVQELQHSLGNRAEIVRALTRSDAFAAQWMFPSAYHIKVIVRDNTSFWLSSGNLNNSNEPDHANPPTTEDRDWHVIIEDAGLAQTFAAFIKQDYASAAAHQAANPDEVEVEIERAHAKTAAEKNPPPPRKSVSVTHKDAGQQLAPQTFSNVDVSITPLLTPDKLPGTQTGQYVTNITGLIKSAQHTLYIQLQYIESSSGSGDYNALLQTIAERVQAGVKVCLIQNAEYGQKWGEKMKSAGVDLTANIRLQPSVHNKGFVVDSQTVVVSSQNFSPQGIEQNRDAGVIIANAEVAGYFEKVFLADWNIAKPSVAHASAATGKGKPAKNAPAKKSSAKKAAKKASAKKATKKAAAKKAAKKTLHKKAATKKAAKKTAKKSRAHAKKPS